MHPEIDCVDRNAHRADEKGCIAIATGRAERDPSADLRVALTGPKVIHRAAIWLVQWFSVPEPRN
jgi:hypothetical protein